MADTDSGIKKLVGKLVEILAEMGPVEKKGRNQHFGYNFISEGQLASELRQRLAKRQLFAFTSVESVVRDSYQNNKGNTEQIATVITKHTFVDAESGAMFSVGGAGMGTDSGDKCVYKAITGAVKYFLMKNFFITDEQDPEFSTGAAAGIIEKHSRFGDENEKGRGAPTAKADLATLRKWAKTKSIDEDFIIDLAREGKMADQEGKLDDLKPGVLTRLLSLRDRIEDRWKEKGSGAKKEAKPAGESTGRKKDENDQTRSDLRDPVQHDLPPAEYLEQEGIDDWKDVFIHFGKQKGKKLGAIGDKSLAWWIQNWVPEKFKGKWQDKDLLLDAALCVAHRELAANETVGG